MPARVEIASALESWSTKGSFQMTDRRAALACTPRHERVTRLVQAAPHLRLPVRVQLTLQRIAARPRDAIARRFFECRALTKPCPRRSGDNARKGSDMQPVRRAPCEPRNSTCQA